MSEQIVETRQCKQCGQPFDITDKDKEFYEKISPVFAGKKSLIPPPTLCPSCRQQRRSTFRNERNLYRRKCDFSGKDLGPAKDIISIYSPDKPFKVYEQKARWGSEWNPLDYGMSFDFNKSFFVQFDELLHKVPLISLVGQSNENCDFTFDNNFSKNCYMSVVVDDGENVFYSNRVLNRSRDVMDSYYIFNGSSLVYESLYINNCHDMKYCFSCTNSTGLTLCSFCENCEDCIGCKNLVGKKYHILNKPYTREEYLAHKDQLNLQSMREQAKDLFATLPVKANTFINTENCQGGNLTGCINCYYGFNGEDSKDVKYSAHFTGVVDCYDAEDICYNVSLSYEGQTIIKNNNHILFSLFMMESNAKCFYCKLLTGCQNCFGCISLRNASYCILNKQYTKEEYEALVPQIIEHMSKCGERGEFFPSSMSPFGYNETIAQEYFPLTREEALNKGFKRSEYEVPFPKVEKILKSTDLPPTISLVSDDILKRAIECEVSKKPFRIIPRELEFYRTNNIPLPHKHPDVRHAERIQSRNPRTLWERKCAKCGADIKTTYSPEKPDIVYCENCYNKEIYG